MASKDRINVFVRLKPSDEPSVWNIISPEEIVQNEPGKVPFRFSLIKFHIVSKQFVCLNVFHSFTR